MTAHNIIIQADCTKAMTELDAASVDFVLTDPPYLVHYHDRDGRSVANDDNSSWLRPAFAQIYRVLKPASFCVSFYAWNRVHLFMAAWRDAGFRPVGHIVFRKRYASSARFLRYEHEVGYLAQSPRRLKNGQLGERTMDMVRLTLWHCSRSG